MRTILFTGGGSAGHVIPNLALFPKLAPSFRLVYAGTDAIEHRLIPDCGIPFYCFSAPKLVRGKFLENLTLPFRLLKSVRNAKQILNEVRPDLVFSKGGYVALPVVFAARAMKIPVLTHESDYSPGLANKLIAKRCRTVLTSFPETARRVKNGTFSGAPIRENLFAATKTAGLQKYGFTGEKPVLLVFGGGSGSAAINRAVENCLCRLLKSFAILHIRGKNAPPPQYDGYVPLEFESDMASAYACSDFVLSRAGSNTVFEILALKKPSLLVPLENGRTRGDQIENALYFEKRGLCRVLRERDLSPERLFTELTALRNDPDLPARLAHAPFKAGNDAICREILNALSESPRP